MLLYLGYLRHDLEALCHGIGISGPSGLHDILHEGQLEGDGLENIAAIGGGDGHLHWDGLPIAHAQLDHLKGKLGAQ